MSYKLRLTLILGLILSLTLGSYAQGIGYRNVNYSPQSESVTNAQVPITPAIKAFTDKIKSDLKTELKSLNKKDPEYDLKRSNAIEASTIQTVNALIEILEIESLKVFEKEQALYSVYHFINCWADSNFKSKKKNFCQGCWDEHMVQERMYRPVVSVEE